MPFGSDSCLEVFTVFAQTMRIKCYVRVCSVHNTSSANAISLGVIHLDIGGSLSIFMQK